MVALRLEELEPRLALATVAKLVSDLQTAVISAPSTGSQASVTAAGKQPNGSAITNTAVDTVQVLINQLSAGSQSKVEFFKNLTAWMYLSIEPYTGFQLSRGTYTANSVLASMWGSCGDRNFVMTAIAKRLGYPATAVNFYHNVPY